MPSDEAQATTMAEWALQLGYSRVAVLYVENAWGQGLKDNFVKTFSAKGGAVTNIETSTDETSDFRSQLTRCRAANPNAIYMPLYQRQAGLAIRQAREIGINQQILGADVYETPELIEAGSSAVNGVLYTTFGRGEGPAQDEFARRYKDRFGEDAGTYAFYSYDAFRIAIAALNGTGGTNARAESVRSFLLSLNDYRGVTGQTSFGGKTSASGKTFDKRTVKNGAFVPWTSSTPQ
jgi:branched-chain amino acid transport system substrate-binding protein